MKTKKKETDTETEKLIHYDFRRFRDFCKKYLFSLTVAFFRAYLVTILKALTLISHLDGTINEDTCAKTLLLTFPARSDKMQVFSLIKVPIGVQI